jgi:hypothetical protein
MLLVDVVRSLLPRPRSWVLRERLRLLRLAEERMTSRRHSRARLTGVGAGGGVRV